MKNKLIIIIGLFSFISTAVMAQSFNELLNTIEENNTEIQAAKKYVESKTYEYKSENLPDGPSFSYGYFPDNSTVSGTKEVLEVSQSFQMPCFYRNQSAYSKLRISQEELSQKVLRQNILIEAKQLLIEYTYRLKQMAIVDKRLKFAEDIYSAYMIRLETGDANALEVNKAKLHLMQVKRKEKDARNEILSIKEKLKYFNGGNDLEIKINDYPLVNLVELDSLLFDKMANDPEVQLNQKAVEVSEKRIKVTKNLQLPELSLGYGSETVADEKFQGVLVGISIPLWGSKRTIQQSKLESEYFSLNNSRAKRAKISETKVMFDKVTTLDENLKSYKNILSSVNNEDLLKQSLELGEISVIEFFTEMFYYYEVYDDFLDVEMEFHQELANLYKYKL
ncbi:MAG: TolC family protein [Bacteroidales bacterium]|nr:TolC family protein [Bacteroidales bacterium]